MVVQPDVEQIQPAREALAIAAILRDGNVLGVAADLLLEPVPGDEVDVQLDSWHGEPGSKQGAGERGAVVEHDVRRVVREGSQQDREGDDRLLEGMVQSVDLGRGALDTGGRDHRHDGQLQ